MNTKVKKALAGLAFGLVMAVCGSANAAIGLQYSPYLIYPNVPTSMQVVWWDYAPSTADTISWGTDITYSSGSATVSTTAYGNGGTGTDLTKSWTSPKDMGTYTITGLNTDTKYYYKVVDANGTAWTGSFITAPDPNATSVRFMAQGDSRSQPYAFDGLDQVMLQFINQTGNADYQRLSIANGDWVATDGDQYWAAEWFQSGQTNVRLYTANIPMNGCKGNHDNKSGWSASFSKYYPYPYATGSGAFTPATTASHAGLTSCTTNSSGYCVDADNNPYYNNLFWSFDYGPVHFTVIDEYSSYLPNSAQYNFVVNDLASTTKPWKIIIYHEPAYSAGHDGDNTAVRALEPIFAANGVDAIFAGHSHNYARTGAYNSTQAGTDLIALNVPHFTSGGGGAPVYNVDVTNAGSYPHVITAWPSIQFMTFDVEGDTMTMTSYQATGINQAASAPQTGLGNQIIEQTVLHHWTDVSSQLGVKVSAISYNRATKTYNGTVTLTNNGAPLASNLDVVLDGIFNLNGLGTPDNEYAAGAGQTGFMQMIASNPAAYKNAPTTAGLLSNVKVVNQAGSQNGEPMVHATSSGLAAGASVSFTVQFQFSSSAYNSAAQNSNGKITFNTRILNH